MDSKQLLALRDEAGVDVVEGRILPSYKDWPDMPTEKTSQQSGKVELCQDVILEMADRTKVVIAFWNLSQRCFSRDGKMDDHVAFDNNHVRKWIRVLDTNPRQKHSLSRRTKGRAPEHYKKKFGIGVYLKATPTVAVEWMLEDGEQAPRMCAPRRVKKMKPLEAPGSKKAGGAKTMSNDQNIPGGRRQGGSNQGQSRDTAAPQGGQSRGTPPTTRPPSQESPPQEREPSRPADPTPEQWRRRASKLNAAAHCRCLSALRELYIKANLHVSDGFLVEAAKTLHIQLTQWKGPLQAANLTLLSAKPDQIKWAINELAQIYFDAHTDTVDQLAAAKEPTMSDEGSLRSHVTTNFISTLNTYPLILPR